MKVFIVSLLFAVLQVFILKYLLTSITSGKNKRAVLIFILKFVLYGAAIALFMNKYLAKLAFCAIGFGIGVIFTSFGLFIYREFIKKN